MMNWSILLVFFYIWNCKSEKNTFVQKQENLHKFLNSKSINPLIVPQKNFDFALPINYQFYVNQIIEADAARSIFSVDGLLVVVYQDFQNEWNTTTFEKIYEIERDAKTSWYPTIILLGGLQITRFPPIGNIKIRHNPPKIYYTIQYDINSMFVVSCQFQVFKFPFDEHHCRFKFQLSALSSSQAYFSGYNNSDIGLSDHFLNHVEWEIKEIHNLIENHTEKETGITMSAYQMTIKISRRSASYMISILLPAIGLMLVSIVIFLLPPESGEKIGLSITVLLSYTVFNLTLYTALPKSKTICLVGWLMAYLELLSVIAIVLSGFVLRCYYRPRTERLSQWTKSILIPGNFLLQICHCHKRRKREIGITTWQEFAVFLDTLFIYLYLVIYSVMIIVSSYLFVN